MAEAIYALCALASSVCALLLVRGYSRTRLRLSLLACVCFGGLAVNNVLLFVDLVLVPELDLSVVRGLVSVMSLFVLVVGLVWEGA